MRHSLDDTIAAVASPRGGAARGIVRTSGPAIYACLTRVFESVAGPVPATIVHPLVLSGSVQLAGVAARLPCEVYLWPEGRSYTGQAVAEFHTLGSPPLLESLVTTLCAAGARPAEPGEFTLRAFLSGRLDLTEAEAVLGVIDAVDPQAVDVALRQLAGGLAAPLARLREQLVELLVELEAGLDFADEELSLASPETLDIQLAEAVAAVERVGRQMASRHDARSSISAVLLGRPNAGKSSLFNALAARSAALVSNEPGTTRDYLVAELDLGGVSCRLIDTAGVDADSIDATDPIVRASVAATERQRLESELQILCLDGSRPADAWEERQLAQPEPRRIVVFTKIDQAKSLRDVPAAILTSSVTGAGLESLRARLREAALGCTEGQPQVVATTAVRCRDSLRIAGECLARARERIGCSEDELVCAELRMALDEIGRVVGTVYTEDILDRVFSRFCIGK